VDRSCKLVIRGEQPEIGDAVKLATGVCARTIDPDSTVTKNAISFGWILYIFKFKGKVLESTILLTPCYLQKLFLMGMFLQ
jgi:hypothetical protein